jgi:hypothetical protein
MNVGLTILAFVAIVAGPDRAFATGQDTKSLPQDTERSVQAADAAYWAAFNACDPSAMARFFSPDLEFYHDKGGVTRGGTAMVDATMKGICSNPNVRVRRAPVAETIRYDSIPGYGAVLSGRHQFYLTETGMPERMSGTAAFDMLWHYENGRWLLTRAFSLDHQAVPYIAPPAGAKPTAQILGLYVGTYTMQKAGKLTVGIKGEQLTITTDTLALTLRAQKDPGHFFAAERPLQFSFDAKANRKATTITVIENGAPVETGLREE